MERILHCTLVAMTTAALLAFPVATYGWLDTTAPDVLKVLDSEDAQFSFYNGPSGQKEWENSGGAKAQSRVKGSQDITGLKFDLSAYRGMVVQEAELHMARSSANPILSLVAATMNTDWSEGTGTGGRTVGAPCYRWRVTPESSSAFTLDNEWTFSHSDLSAITFGNFGTLSCFGFSANDTFKTYIVGSQTWVAMKMDPAVVQALILDQYGLTVTDARMHSRLGYNPTVYTKDQNETVQPQLYIKFADAPDTIPPGAVIELAATAGPENGQVVLQFKAPVDQQAPKAFGYTVRVSTTNDFAAATDVARWRIPRPKTPGMSQRMLIEDLLPETTYYFHVQAYDAAGNGGPIQSIAFTIPQAVPTPTLADSGLPTPDPTGKSVQTVLNVLRYWAASEVAKVSPSNGNIIGGSTGDDYKKANTVWDSTTNTVSLLACRNEVVGAQMLIERLGTTLNNVSVTASDLTSTSGGTIPAATCIEMFQLHYAGGYPEAAIPLATPFKTTFNIPDAARNSGGKNQSVWIDLYVPKETQAGDYTGTLTINALQLTSPLTVNLAVRISRVMIPDAPTFFVDMNGYSNPWNWGGSSTQTDLNVLRYFQVCHKHRVVPNVLPYGHTGAVQSDRVPNTMIGSGPTLHANTWNTFDRRYGPLFDGTAFTPDNQTSPYYGPGMNTPISQFYSTFHESWPILMKDSVYGFDATGLGWQYWQDLKISGILNISDLADMFATLPDIYDAFPAGYRQGLTNVMADWVQHAQAKGWTKTAFQTYHNEKYDSTTFADPVFWVLEENETGDDFHAGGWYHQAWRDGYAQANCPDVKWQFRIDISDRWGQHYGELDNRINYWVMGSGAAAWHWPHIKYRSYMLDTDKQEQWTWYSGSPSATSAGIGMARYFLQRWSQGFVGGVPYWDNFATSWTSPNDLSTIYNGKSIPGHVDAQSQQLAYEGVVLSTRIKTMRQAEQIIELMNLWAGTDGMNRERVRDAIFAKYGNGAWDYGYTGVDETKLYRMRADLIAQLETLIRAGGDANGDGAVDIIDLLMLAGSWGLTKGDPGFEPGCDFNDDNSVDILDLLTLGANWPTG